MKPATLKETLKPPFGRENVSPYMMVMGIT